MRPRWNVRSPRRRSLPWSLGSLSMRRRSFATRTSSRCGYSLATPLSSGGFGQEAFHFENEVAQRLIENGSPVASLDTRVEPRVYERDGFAFTLWRYYEQSGMAASAAAYARALERLHVGMAQLDVVAPHFSDRVREAQRLVASHDRTPRLEDSDRELLSRRCGAAAAGLTSDPHPNSCCMASRTQGTC